ncbi:IclR family transcriptional regulator domain-containing protein [Amycolatopsis pithecellobii]|uniref:IclR family transcriptional regulator domain-containing protein n=1 Tax=Amycolatopsis pithecellobii TaxID=664692 RepID=UPI001AA09703|nr:IclR family transcriptional regulator C-terminal domain-containing protein [Amycolatopsis pithecellobii]
MTAKEADPELVTSAERGLAVLAAFRPEQPAMTLSDVAKATGLDRAAARRFLHTLLARGYLRTEGQHFRLHPAVLELGDAYLAALRLPGLALPRLAALSARFNEPASMAVLEGDQAVFVAHVPSNRLMAANVAVGSRVPAYRSSLGRVLLAGKPDEWLAGYLTGESRDGLDRPALRADIASIRRDGWLTSDEPDAGVRSVAVPVHGDGGTVAAIGISSHADRVSHSALAETIRPALLEAAHRIEQSYAGNQ